MCDSTNELTVIHLVSRETCPPFAAVTYIYDDKVVYITFLHNTFTATIIHDPEIYIMQRSLFDSLWQASIAAGL